MMAIGNAGCIIFQFMAFLIYHLPKRWHWRTFFPGRVRSIREWERIWLRIFRAARQVFEEVDDALGFQCPDCALKVRPKICS